MTPTRNATRSDPRPAARGRRFVTVCAASLLFVVAGAACSSTSDTGTSSTGTSVASGPSTSGPGTTRGTTVGSTPGTDPRVDAAISNLPISADQKACLSEKLNSDPSLKTVISSKNQQTKAESTRFINLMLSCVTRADLVKVILATQPTPDTPEGKCRDSKISQLTEDQLAGFIVNDPETMKQLQALAAECTSLGSSSTTR